MTKLGKTNFDLLFLELIKMGSRYEILEALNPYYDGLKSDDLKIKELDEEYKRAVKNVSHLENKSSLNEDEWIEWEGAVGWYESLGEEFGLRSNSLATGLIIAVWKIMNQVAITSATGLKRKSPSKKYDKFDLFRMGPRVGSEYWALSLNAGSNYVRHTDDWLQKLRPYIGRDSNNWKQKIPDNPNHFKTTKMNLTILENLGLEVDLLVSTNDLSYQVAETIGIIEKGDMIKNFNQWSGAVYGFVEKELQDKV